MKRALGIAAAVVLVVLLLPTIALACPLCKEAASNADKTGQSDVWRGMYWSILLMVSAPFAMVGALIVAVKRARRNLPPPARAPLSFPGTGARS